MFRNGFKGLQTSSQAMASKKTCQLEKGNCDGVVSGFLPSLKAAQDISARLHIPVCSGNGNNTMDCVGIAAVPPAMFGNPESYWWTNPAWRQQFPSEFFGRGLSIASGYCY